MTSSRQQYSRSQLLSLNGDFPLPRIKRRALFFHKILRRTDPSVRNLSLRKQKQLKKRAPSILQFNARSLFNKIDDLRLRASKFAPDVICISESWLDSSIHDGSVSIPNYNLVRSDRDIHGGGVAIFCRSDINVTVVSSCVVDQINSNILCCYLHEFDAHICVIYHPYWGNIAAHDIMVDFIQKLIDSFSSDHIILTGDVNDLRHKLSDLFELNSMKQLVQFPTRGENVLDIVASNQPYAFDHPLSLPPLGRSDHKGIFIKPVTVKPVTVNKVKVRSFSPASFAQCYYALLSVDWDVCCLSFSDIDHAVDAFQYLIRQFYHLFFPEKSVRMRSCDPPWLTPSLKAISDARDKALSRGHYGKFLCLREKFLSEVQKSKLNQQHKIESSSTSEKWKFISKQIKNRSDFSTIDEDKANVLNEQFQSNFTDPDISLFRDIRTSTRHETPSVSEYQIADMIKRCKSNSVGPDGVPGYFYRKFVHVLVYPLTVLFNRCLQAGCFPSSWKLANVLPLSKPNGEHRPISILPFLSKILERLIRDHLLLPSINKAFDSRQFGFLPNSFGGCTNALLFLRLTILQHLSAKSSNICKLLAIDFKKAFDSLSHLSILNTLAHDFNCPTSVVAMIEDFLSYRFQRVSVNGIVTSWKSVSSGVPQGSILGPLLFVLFINDLPRLKNSQIVAYADDVTVVHLTDISDELDFQSDIDSFVDWAHKKKLVINDTKTKSLIVSRHSSPPISNVTINGHIIEEASALKILGVFFSSDNRWDFHVDFLFKKCCRALSLVKRIRFNCTNTEIVWQAYIGLVFSQISFCWPVICDLKNCHFKKFEKLDHIVRRWTSDSSKPTLRFMLDKVCIRLINKVSRFSDCHPLSDFFIVRPINSQTRHQRKLLCYQRKSSFYNKSFVKFSKFT